MFSKYEDRYAEELESDLSRLREQLAKANELAAELEKENSEYAKCIISISERVDIQDFIKNNPTYENARVQLNKFAIENQIKGIDGIKANCNLYKAFPIDKMIARECITVEEVDAYQWHLKEQLRKEQE